MKRAIVVVQGTGYAKGPTGEVIQVKKESTKVMELTDSLEDLMSYAEGKSVNNVTVIFETEDPNPHLKAV